MIDRGSCGACGRRGGLADPVRRDLYLYVSAQPAPVSRDQASDALGIARHAAKFHLDKLAEEGLLDITFKRLSGRRGPGAGRPTKLYARSSRQLSVILPERRYDLAGKLLATAIDGAVAEGTGLADALKAAATDWGRSVGTKHEPLPALGLVLSSFSPAPAMLWPRMGTNHTALAAPSCCATAPLMRWPENIQNWSAA